MKLVPKAVEEVVNFKAEVEDSTAEYAVAVEEKDIMAVVDAEAHMTEGVEIIQVTDGAYRMQ